MTEAINETAKPITKSRNALPVTLMVVLGCRFFDRESRPGGGGGVLQSVSQCEPGVVVVAAVLSGSLFCVSREREGPWKKGCVQTQLSKEGE